MQRNARIRVLLGIKGRKQETENSRVNQCQNETKSSLGCEGPYKLY